MYSNKDATITLYKENSTRTCRDFVIRFNEKYDDIERMIPLAFDIVAQLIHDFHRCGDRIVKGRLVAVVNYKRLDTGDEVKAYHASCHNEVLEDARDFFIGHMLDISERMSLFNQHGSNLKIEHISEIHLHLNCLN